MGSSDSLSLPSEPPDIGEWFSSYVYESPELNSVDDFKDWGCPRLAEIEESEKKKEVNFDENGILEKGNALLADGKATSIGILKCKSLDRSDICSSEVLENSDSLSLLSEPPDVKNWFSSYVYESPALDASDEFRSCPGKFDEEENNAPNCSTGKEEELNYTRRIVKINDPEGQNINSGRLAKCTNSAGEKEYEYLHFVKDIQKADGNKNSAILDDLTPQRLCHQILHDTQMQDHGNGPSKEFELSIPSGESSLDALNAMFNADAYHMLLDTRRRSDSKNGNLPQKPSQRRDSTEESFKPKDLTKGSSIVLPAKNLEFNLVKGKPANKAPGGQENKENGRNDFAETGFISTRKSKQVEDNSIKRPLEGKLYSSRKGVKIPPRGKREAVATRQVLVETTNFQAPNVLELTGKWRCPQKGKPNLGPPLKQLRLEQWVHRA